MASKDLFKVKDTPMTLVGGSNYDDVSDYSVRKVISSKEGTVTKVPNNDFDIANKKYVDDQIGGTDTTLNVSGQTVLSGAIVIMSGANITLSQTGQTITAGVVGLAIGTDVQAYDADLTTWAGITPGTGVGTFLATPTSANLAAAVTDETGSGALVFGTLPTISGANMFNGTMSGGTITGITDLVVADGGTGASTFTDGGVILGNGTGALAVTTAGTSGQYLVSQGASTDPVFQTIAAASSDMVLLATGTATAATSLTVNFTSTGYAKLAIYFDRFSTSGGDGITMTLNTIATGYVGRAIFNDGGTIGNRALGTTSIEIMNAPGSGTNESSGEIYVSDPDGTLSKT